MTTTDNLGLPYISAAQAQKHVTHNEALRALDAVIQLAVVSRTIASPPTDPTLGARYIVGPTGVSDWASRDNEIAIWVDGTWSFQEPQAGWIAWLMDDEMLVVWNGSTWEPVPGNASSDTIDQLGIGGATPDATNKLSIKSDAALFSHDDVTPGTGDMRQVLNKDTATDTVSQVYQSGFVGHAEVGLTGDNDFHFKVSPDGVAFHEGILIDKDTGQVSFPKSLIGDAQIFNIMSDGGRFAGSPEPSSVTVSTFEKPAWMSLTNGATVTEHAKFHRNSVTYGGTGTAIDADIQELMALVINASYRRYYPEFFVALVTAGSGTGSAVTFDDTVTRYTSTLTASVMRPVALTVSFYIKATNGDVGIPVYSTTTIHVDGVRKSAHTVIPTDGDWHHVRIVETGAFTQHYRTNNNSVRLYQRDGHEALIAFPAAVPGRLAIPIDIGQVPSLTAWA